MTTRRRGQANVVGIAILIGVTVVALGALTASIGTVVEEDAARADAQRVADGFERTLDARTTTGHTRGRIAFADGELRPVDRQIRVFDADGVVRTVEADALVFEAGARRVTYLGGAVVRGQPPGGPMPAEPPITAARDGDALVVGVATVGDAATAVGGSGPVVLRANVSHRRESLGTGRFRVAVETATLRPWRTYFERTGAIVTTRDIDGDGTKSVVARYPGDREAWLVVHDLRVEVAA